MVREGTFRQTCSSGQCRRPQAAAASIVRPTSFRLPITSQDQADLYGEPVSARAPNIGLLQEYGWPGNVRELPNVMEHAHVIAPPNQVTLADLPRDFKRLVARTPQKISACRTSSAAPSPRPSRR